MKECNICNVCDAGTSIEESLEVNEIPCDVRKFAGDMFTVWRCSSCGSLHSKDIVDLDYYYQHYPLKKHSFSFHTKIAYNNRIRLLRKVGITKADSILDYGCGNGLFVDFLTKKGFSQVQGYDPLIERFNDGNTIKKRYDVVTSYDVIEHVEEPTEYLKMLVDLVSPGGKLIIGTPNASFLSLVTDPNADVELSQPYHRHILSEEALFELASKVGLKKIDTYRRFYFDSLIPFVNTRFLWSYVQATGGKLDAVVEPFRLKVIFMSPKLLFFAMFGYFFPSRGNILVSFAKST